jgi:UDP-N-acetylglucosamine--N-acetylmuramyl-(pentapeptide) pyrophosphoryl-undecaprenol N-acetylglucosamine transferase
VNKVSAVFYCINGTGLGHITRLTNIAREMKILLIALSISADIQILTTSDAPQVAYDIPTWKIPSKTVINSSEYANQKYIGDANFFVTNFQAIQRPDFLIVDTVPQCSFGEFLNLKRYAGNTVFINRHRKEEIASEPISQECMRLYDLILTPDFITESAKYSYLTPELSRKNTFTSPIHGYRPEKSLTREKLREYFSVKEGQKIIYISAGGGGDSQAESILKNLVDTISNNSEFLILIGYGALYRGPKIYRQNVIPLTEVDVRQYFNGLDAAICAAGYNTYEELIAAKVPSAFYSLDKGWDSQSDRILNGADNGYNLLLESFEPECILSTLDMLLGQKADSIRSSLDTRETVNGSIISAYEILKLKFGMRSEPKAYQNLVIAAQIRNMWSDFMITNGIGHLEPDFLYAEVAKIALLYIEYALSQDLVEMLFEDSRIGLDLSVTTKLMNEFLTLVYNQTVIKMTTGLSLSELTRLIRKISTINSLDKSEFFELTIA